MVCFCIKFFCFFSYKIKKKKSTLRAARGDELFGYYECEKGVAFAEKAQAESPVVDRWNEYMKDILELVMDPETGAQPKLEPVFRLD